VRYGGLLLSQNEKVGLTATVLFNTSSLNAVPTYANLMSNAFKQAKSGPGSSIKVSNHPFPLAKTETIEKVVSAAVNLLATFVIIIAYSFIPAAIVAYVVRERKLDCLLDRQSSLGHLRILRAFASVHFLPLGI